MAVGPVEVEALQVAEIDADGRLAEGYIITDGDVDTWDATEPDAGTVAGLIRAIEEGRASVVVHTDDLDPETPTGVEGDSRAGELRGTLLPDDDDDDDDDDD